MRIPRLPRSELPAWEWLGDPLALFLLPYELLFDKRIKAVVCRADSGVASYRQVVGWESLIIIGGIL